MAIVFSVCDDAEALSFAERKILFDPDTMNEVWVGSWKNYVTQSICIRDGRDSIARI